MIMEAAKRAQLAGFDMLELHCAHGYLLASFLSPLTNQRNDAFGGSIEARSQVPLKVFKAIRAVWPQEKPISVRISACDWEEEEDYPLMTLSLLPSYLRMPVAIYLTRPQDRVLP